MKKEKLVELMIVENFFQKKIKTKISTSENKLQQKENNNKSAKMTNKEEYIKIKKPAINQSLIENNKLKEIELIKKYSDLKTIDMIFIPEEPFLKRSNNLLVNSFNHTCVLMLSESQVLSYVYNTLYQSKIFSYNNFDRLQKTAEGLMLKTDFIVYSFEKAVSDWDTKLLKFLGK